MFGFRGACALGECQGLRRGGNFSAAAPGLSQNPALAKRFSESQAWRPPCSGRQVSLKQGFCENIPPARKAPPVCPRPRPAASRAAPRSLPAGGAVFAAPRPRDVCCEAWFVCRRAGSRAAPVAWPWSVSRTAAVCWRAAALPLGFVWPARLRGFRGGRLSSAAFVSFGLRPPRKSRVQIDWCHVLGVLWRGVGECTPFVPSAVSRAPTRPSRAIPRPQAGNTPPGSAVSRLWGAKRAGCPASARPRRP